jgi:hypothetical protein
MTKVSTNQKEMALFAIGKLSDSLRFDVLRDGKLAKAYELALDRSVKLSPELAFDRDKLFTAFRRCADGQMPGKLKTKSGGAFVGKIEIDGDGTGIVEHEKFRWYFEGASLLASTPKDRLKALAAQLRRKTLFSGRAAELKKLVAKAKFATEDFLHATMMLEAAPESWGKALSERLQEKDGITGRAMLLPSDDTYWDNLIPPVQKSKTLDEFIEDELRKEWSSRLRRDLVSAFRSISLTFGGTKLVSKYLIEERKPNDATIMLASASRSYDPYSIVGAYELCREFVGKIPDLEAVGGQLLDQISKKPEDTQLRCQVLAAVFMITTAHLAQHATLSMRPVYWRRLAAMAHASLALRHIGVPKTKSDRIVPWAARQSGDTYLVSVFNEFSVEPRWRPEWISDQMLVADALGRIARPLLSPIPVPASWSSRIARVTAWLEKRSLTTFCSFPAALEGAAAPPPISLEGDDELTKAYRDFIAEPSPPGYGRLTPLVLLFGFPKDATSSIVPVVRELKAQGATLDQDEAQRCLSASAYVAALHKDLGLADVVAEAVLEATRRAQTVHAVREGVSLLLETSSANTDRKARRSALVRRLENLAFTLKSRQMCAALCQFLVALQCVDRDLAPALYRAFAAASLGAQQD